MGLLLFAVQASAAEATSAQGAQVYLPLVSNSGEEQVRIYPLETASFHPLQLAWFYKPPSDGDLHTLQENFSQFILTKNDERARDSLRAQGVQGPFLQYLRFEAIHDPGSCAAQPWRNQVADQTGDFCRIIQQHPDWFLLDVNGNRIVDVTGGERFYMMDPGNPGWRAFWLERARHSQESLGWDGVFLDNVEASLYHRRKAGIQLARYPDEVSYVAAVEGFLAYLYTSYFQPAGRPLQANITATDPAAWFRYLRYLDGAMDEGWGVDWSSGYLSPRQWEENLSRAEQTQAMGKQVILVAQGERSNTQRQQFAYASYLLVTGGSASFRYSSAASGYRDAWLYSNYDLDLGAPLGPRYQEGGKWRRDFANGHVIVDPTARSATIATD
jgi:hypothetical protein